MVQIPAHPPRKMDGEQPTSEYVKVMRIKGANGEEKTLQFPLRLDLERPKRARTTFSEDQLRVLDEAYRSSGYLTGERRNRLADTLGLTDTQVKVWFQNRRTKDRKRKSEEEQPSPSPPRLVPRNILTSLPPPMTSSPTSQGLPSFPPPHLAPLSISLLFPKSSFLTPESLFQLPYPMYPMAMGHPPTHV